MEDDSLKGKEPRREETRKQERKRRGNKNWGEEHLDLDGSSCNPVPPRGLSKDTREEERPPSAQPLLKIKRRLDISINAVMSRCFVQNNSDHFISWCFPFKGETNSAADVFRSRPAAASRKLFFPYGHQLWLNPSLIKLMSCVCLSHWLICREEKVKSSWVTDWSAAAIWM